MASGVKDLASTLSARVASALITIAIQGCLAWFLLPDGRGSYAVCLIFSTLLVYVFSFGSDIAFNFFLSSRKMSLSEAITHSFILVILISLVATTTGYLLLKSSLSFTRKASQISFFLSLAYIPIFLFANIYLQIFTAIYEFRFYSILIILRELNRLIFILFFVLGLALNVNGALLANICSDFIIVIVSLFVYYVKFNLRITKVHFLYFRDLFSYGIRYYLGRLSNILNLQIGTMILAFFATKNDIGLFSVATALTTKVEMIPDAFFAVLFPRISSSDTGRKVLVARCARITGLVCGMILLALGLFAEPVINILFSPAFLGAKPIIRILAIGTAARCGCKIFVPYLLGTGYPGTASVSVAVGVTINVLLMYILLPLLGLTGAAVSVSINYLLSSLILSVSFMYLTGLGFRDIFVFNQADYELLHILLNRFKQGTESKK